jgi:CO/xanthine dehydrogenase Mo-binding subunit
MHEREFSRKSFLKGGGAMVIGFSIAGAGLAGKAVAADSPYASNAPYDYTTIDSWLIIHADNTVTAKLGKEELGQGSATGLSMIIADELDVKMSQMKFQAPDTNITPNQGATVGSGSISGGGRQVRAAAAAARSALLGLAATRLGVAQSSLSVKDGVVSGGGKTVTYGELIGDKLFSGNTNVTVNGFAGNGNATTAAALSAGAPGTKPIDQLKIVGTSPPRMDIPDKVTGKYTYVHSIKVPGMLHGRVVRPRGQGAYGLGTGPSIVSVDESSVRHIPGVKVLRFQNFLGVVAEREYDAIQAAAQLKVKWADLPTLPTSANQYAQMRKLDSAGQIRAALLSGAGNFDSAFTGAAKTVSQTYQYAYNGHLPIGPSCAVADVAPDGSGARIFSNAQDVYGMRTSAQQVLATVMGSKAPALNRVHVSYYEGSSVYGSSPQIDVGEGAAILSALAGKPVRLQFMRWDEHGYDNYGPLQMMDIRGGVDANGNITSYEYTQFGQAYYTTAPSQQLVNGSVNTGTATDATQIINGATVSNGNGSFDTSNSGNQYNIPNVRRIGKTLPLANNYFKATFLRGPLSCQTCFGSEQFIDELAHTANMDPYQFRLQNIATPSTPVANDLYLRWKNVLTNVGALSNWKPKVAASSLKSGDVVTGRGLALGQFASSMTATVADVEVNKKTGKIVVKDIYCCQDSGLGVYIDGIGNQAVGSLVQGASRALWEEVTFNKTNVTSLDWVSYPILRFKDSPKIHFKFVQRTDIPQTDGTTVAATGARSTGSGEPPTAAIGAAIANAFFDATGVRIRTAPMTPARVRATLKAAGK